MTKYFDWARFKEMSPRQKAGVTTESTFSEQRKEDKEKSPKDFGIKQMEEEVNIDWGKSIIPDSAYDRSRRALEKIAAAEAKATQLDEESDSEDAIEDEK